ncbi:MAG: M56 family metallopeptidase [Firmicutes bacterium]|nr:M56 family metallopeptidase [Bacillota bacterium]
MRIAEILVTYVLLVLVTGFFGYALVRLSETVLSISSRTRQLLYAAVMALPLTAFSLAMVHWAEVCSFITNRLLNRAKLLIMPLSGNIILLLSGLALLNMVRARRNSNIPYGRLPVVKMPTPYERVYKLLAELEASPLELVIYDFPHPIACVRGVREPRILLTSSLLEIMDDRELKAVLAHELAHIIGHDNLLNRALALVRKLTFFSPVMRLAYTRYGIAREEVADDFAASKIEQPADLASALVKVVRASQEWTRCQPQATGHSALESSLALQRAERILNDPYKVPHNFLLENGLLFLVISVMPMLFC